MHSLFISPFLCMWYLNASPLCQVATFPMYISVIFDAAQIGAADSGLDSNAASLFVVLLSRVCMSVGVVAWSVVVSREGVDETGATFGWMLITGVEVGRSVAGADEFRRRAAA